MVNQPKADKNQALDPDAPLCEICGDSMVMQPTIKPWIEWRCQHGGKKVSEWISVTERLPDVIENGYLWVRVYDAEWESQYEAFLNSDGEWESVPPREPIGKITHWMPLPTPPTDPR